MLTPQGNAKRTSTACWFFLSHVLEASFFPLPSEVASHIRGPKKGPPPLFPLRRLPPFLAPEDLSHSFPHRRASNWRPVRPLRVCLGALAHCTTTHVQTFSVDFV